MDTDKYEKALRLMEMALKHSNYETCERVRNEAEKWFNELIKLENKK